MVDTPKWVSKWESERGKGKARFIFLRGVLAYGGIMFVLMTFILAPPPVLDFRQVAIAGAIWGAAGAVFGVLVWAVAERRYRKHLALLGEHGGA